MYQDVKKKLQEETQMRLVLNSLLFLCDFYLCQGGYILDSVCLSVCLSVCEHSTQKAMDEFL